VGVRSFSGNPFDGHTLAEQLEQVGILSEEVAASPKQVVVDLGYRAGDEDNPGIEIIHRGKIKSLSKTQRRGLKRRQAVEPTIGHLKHDNAMDRCWLKGQTGDALHAVLCAAGYNIRWLLRAMVRLGLRGLFACLGGLLAWLEVALATALGTQKIHRSMSLGTLG
jgi:IS5 family transposase